jgi:hypothetical protein
LPSTCRDLVNGSQSYTLVSIHITRHVPNAEISIESVKIGPFQVSPSIPNNNDS